MKRLMVATFLAAACLFALTPGSANAVAVFDASGTVNGTQALHVKASFDVSVAGFVTLTLENLGPDINENQYVLTALFFNIANSPTLTFTAANICAGCSFEYASALTGGTGNTDVKGEWAYKGTSAWSTYNYGVGTAGLNGVFGAGNVSGTDRNNKQAPDGLDFGLLPAGWSSAGDTIGLSEQGPLVKNATIFTFTYTGTPLTDADFQGVYFAFGTGAPGTEPYCIGPRCFPTVPEGSTLALLGMGLIGVAGVARKFRQSRG